MKHPRLITALILAAAATSFNAYSVPAEPYSTANTEIGKLMADPAAKAILDKKFPLLGESSAVASGMADGMTLMQLQQFKPEIFTDEALKEADTEFAKLPTK